jgi:hypothetical protein
MSPLLLMLMLMLMLVLVLVLVLGGANRNIALQPHLL